MVVVFLNPYGNYDGKCPDGTSILIGIEKSDRGCFKLMNNE